jgi:threonylcarbamoyladenosine tRNA methylthiotransferase MtaB
LSIEVLNFGCRLNLAEGEALREAFSGEEDLILVNTCAVTAEAERQARQAIRRAAARRPDAKILVTGCAAQTSRDGFLSMPQVRDVVDKRNLRPPVPAVSGDGHARAFIEVQNGCDHRCTFCIIPFGRGESRSIAPGMVTDAVRQALESGRQTLLKAVPALKRLRLSSLDPIEIDPLLEDLLCNEQRIMPHVHLSLQHGDDIILKRMKRRHSRADAIALVDRLKRSRPEMAVGADIIAGFPTEDETAFRNSLSLLDACDIVFGHVFPYSPRPGTPAARMPQVARVTIRDRAKRLRHTAQARKSLWLSRLVGTRQSVLVELDGRTGHAPNFACVAVDQTLSSGNMRGLMVDVRITGTDGATLFGEVA